MPNMNSLKSPESKISFSNSGEGNYCTSSKKKKERKKKNM